MYTKKYYLSVLALFKNESHIFREWMTHYLKEGVDHFYLIDNGSTDNYVSVLYPFRDKISFYYDATPHNQRNMYMKCYDTFKNETEWLLVIDLDEFVYGNGTYTTIASVLHQIEQSDPYIVSVRIPWTVFGSSGYNKQPRNVVKSFRQRRSYVTPHNEFTKSVFRPEHTTNFNNHVSYCLPPYRIYNVSGIPRTLQEEDWFIPVTEQLLRNSELRLNHYVLQSFEFYTKVKMQRGDSQHKTNERSVQTFHDLDKACNDVYDCTLYNKHYSFSTPFVSVFLILVFVFLQL